jgi:hypothetical protein
MAIRFVGDHKPIRRERCAQFAIDDFGPAHASTIWRGICGVKIVSLGDPHHNRFMSDYAYKPRLGFDIRVRPPRARMHDATWWAAGQACQAPGCSGKALARVARSPREPQTRIWLCEEHVRAHNAQWNFFEGLNETEAEAARLAGLYGDRPTWSFTRNDRARGAARARGPADFVDPFDVFRGPGRREASPNAQEDSGSESLRNGRKLPRLQAQAFVTLGLPASANAAEIRRRYAELLRRYHPDANGGDRSAESQLSAVVKAHQLLKKARLC